MKIPNIGSRGRRRRLIFGVVWLGIAALLTEAVVLLIPASIVRGVVFVPLWLGALGIFQALDKT